jgi:hypothetical protein
MTFTYLKTMNLTLPHQSVEYWPAELEVPFGRDVILKMDVPEGETATLVVGRVRHLRAAE